MVTWLNAVGDRLITGLVRGYFTKSSFLAHAVVYPVLMLWDGGDFHRFLDGISIEAVFVGLMVGISTKQAIAHTKANRQLLHKLLGHRDSDEKLPVSEP